jgi:hypothetical protein
MDSKLVQSTEGVGLLSADLPFVLDEGKISSQV